MKQGKSITELAAELERQMKTKKDYKAPAGRLAVGVWDMPEGPRLAMEVAWIGAFGIKETAHDQIGEYTGIPAKYYDRLRQSAPALWGENVNHWLQKAGAEQRLVRTLDGDVRALLSDRYRPLDNYDLLEAILPVVTGDDEFRVASCEVTDRRLYLQVLNERIRADVKKGDEVQAGIVISNSEIGGGSLRIEPMVYRVVCTNGMIAGEALRKYHVGRAGSSDIDNAVEFYRDETRRADDRAFWLKVQDAVIGAFDETRFRALARQLEGAAADPLPESVELPQVVEVVSSRFGFSEAEKASFGNHFLRGGDFTRYGVLNAVTRSAQDSESYDRAIEIERFGGQVLELETAELVPVKR